MRIEKSRITNNDKEALNLYLQMVEQTTDGTKTITEEDVWYVLADTPLPPPKTEEEIKDEIRQRRETECFAIINRGTLWYSRLSDEQISELNTWYSEWLDAPQTGVIPERPSWLE